MNEETRNRLSAWFDGECPDDSAIEALLERDAEARAYVEKLREMREALSEAHAKARLPAPEWDRVAARLDETERTDSRRIISFPRAIGAIAAVMILGMALWIPFRQAGIEQASAEADLMVNSVEMVETDIENATPVVYLDQPSGWTVVWVIEDTESAGI